MEVWNFTFFAQQVKSFRLAAYFQQTLHDLLPSLCALCVPRSLPFQTSTDGRGGRRPMPPRPIQTIASDGRGYVPGKPSGEPGRRRELQP